MLATKLNPSLGQAILLWRPYMLTTKTAANLLQEESHGKGGDPISPGEVDPVARRAEEVGLSDADVEHHSQ